MRSLVETRIQKFILLIGGIIIFIILLESSYYSRWESILSSVGIAVLVFVLLTILRGYQPSKRTSKAFYFILIVLTLATLFFSFTHYKDKITEQERLELAKKEKQETEKKYHEAEWQYQQCLDKVADLNEFKEVDWILFGKTNKRIEKTNKYHDEWVEKGRPYFKYNNSEWTWELAFMKWMMENHKDFCQEFDTSEIDYFLEIREKSTPFSLWKLNQ